MKRFLFIFCLLLLLFSAHILSAYAALPDPGSLDIEVDITSPSGSVTAESSHVVFKISESACPGESKVTFYWDNLPPGDNQNWWSNGCGDFSGGTARYSQPEGFYAGTYKLGYSCGCPPVRLSPTNETGTISIVPMNGTPEFSYEPTELRRGDPQSKLIARNCVPDSKVTFTYTNLSGLQQYGQYIDTETQVVTADGNGNGYYQRSSGFNPGLYTIKIRCGGKEVEAGQFTVSNQAVTPTAVPEPPPPGCKRFAQGKCVAVDTAIGVINTTIYTTEEGFIMNIFIVFFGLSGGIALLIVIYAGYLIMTSRGNPEQLQKGRELLISALVGLLFVIFSFVIFEVLTVDILHIPGFSY